MSAHDVPGDSNAVKPKVTRKYLHHPRWVGGSWGTELAAKHTLAIYDVLERRRNVATVTGNAVREHTQCFKPAASMPVRVCACDTRIRKRTRTSMHRIPFIATCTMASSICTCDTRPRNMHVQAHLPASLSPPSLQSHTYIRIHIHTYMHTCMRIHTYTSAYIHTYTHTHIRTYAHTHTNT